MSGQFLCQAAETLANLQKLGMVLPMDRANFVEKRAETGDLFARVLVVCILDMSDQVGEQLCLPVAIPLRGTHRLVRHLQRA